MITKDTDLALLANIIRSSDDAIISKGLDSIVTSWNPAAENLFGYTAKEIIGHSITKLIPDELLHEEDEIIQKITNGDLIDHFETKRKRKDGKLIDVSISVSPIKTKAGTIIGASKIVRDISERKNAKKEIQNLTKEVLDYQHALDASSIVAITDKQGTINYVNDNFCRISKYSREELLGQNHRIVNSGYHTKEFFREMWATIAKGKIWKGELCNRAKDGSIYWVDTTIVPFLNDAGKPYQFVAIRSEITDRKLAEAKLKKSEGRFRGIIEFGSDIISLLDKNLNVLYRSPSVEKLLNEGMDTGTFEQPQGNRADLVHPDDKVHYLAVLKEAVNNPGKTFQINFRTQKHSGDYVHFIGYVVNHLDDESIGAIVINVRDVTEMKKAETEIKNSERRFRALVENSHSVINVLDKNFRSIYRSPNAEKLTGYSNSERNESESFAWVHPDDLQLTQDFFKKCINNPGIPENIILRIKHKDGKYRWLDITATNLFNDESVKGIVINARNISELKEAEVALAEANSNLELKIKERTEQLDKVNKDLEAFSYSVSHDLRAPLRAVNGYAKMLEEDYEALLDANGLRLINTIQHNANQMGNLIDNLLAFSRLGKKELQKTMVDMDDVVTRVADELSVLYPNTLIKRNELQPILGDSTLLKQVWINFISNALKYSSKNEKPVVEISSKPDGNEIIYSVRDNGVGFDMAYADKLFKVFQRLHNQEDFEGTGVGLAMVERIVTKHGGRVWAESHLGQGASFYFAIPNVQQ